MQFHHLPHPEVLAASAPRRTHPPRRYHKLTAVNFADDCFMCRDDLHRLSDGYCETARAAHVGQLNVRLVSLPALAQAGLYWLTFTAGTLTDPGCRLVNFR